MSQLNEEAVKQALSRVIDPELGRSITDLDMVREISIDAGGAVKVGVDLTIAGCPLQAVIEKDVKAEVSKVPGVSAVTVEMGVMDENQRAALKEKLSGPQNVIPFTQPDNLTRIYAITSGKGGVGKSSMTANLALSLAMQGLKVGVLDADIYGFSIPRMLGVSEEPTVIDGMIVPPVAGGVKVISIGMFVPDGNRLFGAVQCYTAPSSSS